MEAHDCNFHDVLQRCINDRCPLHRALRLLAANLATAAALCEAFRQGFEEGFGISGEGFNAEYSPRLTTARFTAMAETASYDHEWRPGCGRPAQGWGK